MSADNYYVIRKHPSGGFAALMGFASDEEYPEARVDCRQFDSIEQAFMWASEQETEYGVSAHPEVTKGAR